MNQESLGKLFKNGDVVYKCVAYADTPTITMQNIETGEKINMSVNSLLATCFEEVIEDNKKIKKLVMDYAYDIEEKIFYEKGDKPNHCIVGDAGTELLIGKINEIIDKLNEVLNEKD